MKRQCQEHRKVKIKNKDNKVQDLREKLQKKESIPSRATARPLIC